MSANTDADLDVILKKSQDKAWSGLLPDEIRLLIAAFLPSQSLPLRSKAYITLSALCQHLREKNRPSTQQGDAATDAIVTIFASCVSSCLGDTVETEALSGLSFLTALFQVDWQAASAILTQDGLVDAVIDSIDIFSSSLPISRAVAQLLGQAAGHKSSRAVIPSQSMQWLESKFRQTADNTLRAAAAVALVKLSRGVGADAAAVSGTENPSPTTDDQALVGMMKSLVIAGPDSASLNDAVEGLAYLSVDPSFKEMLSKDADFLKRLFAIIPRRKGLSPQSSAEHGMTPLYGTMVIISNLCTYPPRLTEEEAQIAKLRRLAKTPANGSSQRAEPEANALEDDQHVAERGRRLIRAGVLDALTSAVRATESRAVRSAVGRSLLSLAEDKGNRGLILQAGGAKSLVTIINGLLPPSSASIQPGKLPQLEPSDFEPIQALAKLAITASPVQVFGPNEGALFDAIRPFSLMLVHTSSNLLQTFEAMMALTNLSSQSPEAATRVAKAEGLMNKVELLMLEDHVLIRRAATELICNLVAGSEEIYNASSGSKSKLQVLVALCDVDDLPTRLAASGALAALTSSPDACQSLLGLQRERRRVLPNLVQLIDSSITLPPGESDGDYDEDEVEEIARPSEPDPGLVHRGVVCLRNWFVGVQDTSARIELAQDAQRLGTVQALVRVFRGNAGTPDPVVARPAAEVLKVLMECGIPITL